MKLVEPLELIERQIDKNWDGGYIDPASTAYYIVQNLEHNGFVIIHRGY